MLPLHITLSYYKRKEIQEEIINNAMDREVATRFNDHFGKRPDILQHEGDILELVKQGATSFHASEELWHSPLRLTPEIKRRELEDLRKGWDLVLDIDCTDWGISKIITWLIVKALRENKIRSISIKFSGNKGFHIGVPFEAFPKEFNKKKTERLFPDLPRAIATFILDYVSEKLIEVKEDNSIVFGGKFRKTFTEIQKITTKPIDELTKRFCSECNSEIKKIKKHSIEFVCPKCQNSIKDSKEEYVKCKKCDIFMKKFETKSSVCKCGSNKFYRKFDASSIIDLDTILISSRHLYRMPYSLHEKSGLASRPFNPDKVLNFEKKFAEPSRIKVSKWRFLDKENAVSGEMKSLCFKAMEFVESKKETEDEKPQIEYEDIGEVPEELFPPCIKLIEKIKDGRKRAVFILKNFLTSVGWGYDKIEEYLLEWNKKLDDPLREVIIRGQLRYQKQQKKRILPPNCSNKMYYQDIGICKPDNLCNKIKNPVNYARRKGRFLNKKIKDKKK